jgi:hypothetical protein
MTRSSTNVLVKKDPILAKAAEAKRILQQITELLEENSSEKYRGSNPSSSSPFTSAQPQTPERGKDQNERCDT